MSLKYSRDGATRAEVYGTLGQKAPASATSTRLYTCPSTSRADVTVFITNRDATADAFRLRLAIGNAESALYQYYAYDQAIVGNTTETISLKMDAGDVLHVYSTNGTVTFQVNGIQQDR